MAEKKVRLQDTKGVEYVAPFGWLKQQLGVCKLEEQLKWMQTNIQSLFKRIDQLTNDIIDVETPRMKLKILSLLTDNPEMRTRQITEKTPWGNKILWHSFQKAFKELQDEGAIIGTSHGAGHNRTWRVA